jgi:hypothetical protein
MNNDLMMMEFSMTREEVNSLLQVIDAGLKATGVQSAKAVAMFLGKLEAATKVQTVEPVGDQP